MSKGQTPEGESAQQDRRDLYPARGTPSNRKQNSGSTDLHAGPEGGKRTAGGMKELGGRKTAAEPEECSGKAPPPNRFCPATKRGSPPAKKPGAPSW